jgi:hypothetical protein
VAIFTPPLPFRLQLPAEFQLRFRSSLLPKALRIAVYLHEENNFALLITLQ